MAAKKNKKQKQPGSKPPKKNKLSAEQTAYIQGLMAQAMSAHRLGNLAIAEKGYRQILSIDPVNLDARQCLADIAERYGQIEAALALYSSVVSSDPKRYKIHFKIGQLQAASEQFDKAIAAYQKSVNISPGFIEGWNNLGLLYKREHRYAEAVDCFKTATKRQPDNGYSWSNLGNTLKDWGKVAEAVEALRHACEVQSGLSSAYSNYLVALNYLAELAPSFVYQEHRAWPDHCAASLLPERFDFTKHDWSTRRKLRIAYVSPDLHRHSVAFFIASIFTYHSDDFDVYVYDCDTVRDTVNQGLRAHVKNWREVAGKSDNELAELIYKDQVDILVDLCGHMADNRLTVFRQKPAPMQVTWIGYPNTTGLPQIDYRITDAVADPAGEADALHSEKLLRLETGFLCFQGDEQAPEPLPLPCLTKSMFTYGSFNNSVKMSEPLIHAWIQILKANENSRLLIKSAQLEDRQLRQGFIDRFVEAGIAPERLELLGLIRDSQSHLAKYHEVDLALDTFPYNGTTTSCEAMWMGVPVLGLKGNTHAGRVGASLLHRVGLDEFVAETVDEYISKAIGFASQQDRLARLRSQLRTRMQTSALGDGAAFTMHLETSFKKLWRELCETKTSRHD